MLWRSSHHYHFDSNNNHNTYIITMGQQRKYHVADNGDIFKINEDGSFTAIGNASQVECQTSESPRQVKETTTAAFS